MVAVSVAPHLGEEMPMEEPASQQRPSRGHTSRNLHGMKLLVTIAVYISRRRGDAPSPSRLGALFCQTRQTPRHFPTLPGGVPRNKRSVLAAGCGGGDVLTPGLRRTTAF